MKLHAPTYVSPIPTEGTFTGVFIEEKNFVMQRGNSFFSILFEMYYFREDKKVVLDQFDLAFLGMNADEVDSNRTTVISIPNPDYNSLIAGIPQTIQDPNPEYNAEVEGSEEFLTITNPDFAAIPVRVDVPMFNYIEEHGMPEDYQMVDWGFPTFEDVLSNFNGGTLTDPELTLNNDFAKNWLLNTAVIKGQLIGVQFQFVE